VETEAVEVIGVEAEAVDEIAASTSLLDLNYFSYSQPDPNPNPTP